MERRAAAAEQTNHLTTERVEREAQGVAQMMTSPPLPRSLLPWEGRAPRHGRPLHVAARHAPLRRPPLAALLRVWPTGAPLLRLPAVAAGPTTKLGALRREAARARRPPKLWWLLLRWRASVGIRRRSLARQRRLVLRQGRLVVALPSRHGRRHLLLLHLRRRKRRLLLPRRRRRLQLLRLRRLRAALPKAQHGVNIPVHLVRGECGRGRVRQPTSWAAAAAREPQRCHPAATAWRPWLCFTTRAQHSAPARPTSLRPPASA